MRKVLALLAFALPAAAQAARPPAAAEGLTILAAASLTDAFTDIGHLWQAQGHRITFDFAASSTLAEQISHGAPADIFASADEKWMDRLATEGRIRTATRFDLAGNTLVLVERREALKKVTIKRGISFDPILGTVGRLAVGETATVPAGIYARQALEWLGVWPAVQERLAPADSVRGALLLVARGETPAGIVYGTDARLDPHLAIAGTFPAESHDPIHYPVAITNTGNMKEAELFIAFLHTQPAQDVLLHYGFPPP
jgi:molybdate transport system substrate-binding protein